jgi:hypothetical protein
MSRASAIALVSALAALVVAGTPSAGRAVACAIDVGSATAQFRAAAGAQHTALVDECAGAPPVSAFYDSAVGFSYSQVEAEIASAGQVLIDNYSHNLAFGWPYGEYHYMDGQFFLPDLIITGGPATNLTTALNVTYGGSWIYQDCSATCPEVVGGTWSASVHQAGGGQIATTGTQAFDYIVGAAPEVASATLTAVPVGTTFGLLFSVRFLNIGVNPVTTIRHAGFMEFLASSVFDLPEGYTLDSVSGNISSNTWSAVPEPHLALLLAAGASLYILRARGVQ